MTLFRILVVLAIALAVLLGVVALRAETTRLQYLTSRLDQEAEQSLEQLRQHELELARLRNPMIIRERARALVWPGTEGAAPAAKPADNGGPKPGSTSTAKKSAPDKGTPVTGGKTANGGKPPAAGKTAASGKGKPATESAKPRTAARTSTDKPGTKPPNNKANKRPQ